MKKLIVCLIVLALAGSVSAAITWGAAEDIVITAAEAEPTAEIGFDPYNFNSITIEAGGSLTVLRLYSGGQQAGQDITVNGGSFVATETWAQCGYDYDTIFTQNAGVVQVQGLAIGRNAAGAVYDMKGGLLEINSSNTAWNASTGYLIMPPQFDYGTQGTLIFSGGTIKVYLEDWSAGGNDILSQSWFDDQSGGATVTWDGSVTIISSCTEVGTAEPTSLEVYEKAAQGPTTGEFTVVLDSSPGATDTIIVDIDPNSNGNGVDLTVIPEQLTFTDADWDTAQTVTVTAIDDTWADGKTEVDQVGFTVTSTLSDPCYANACISSVSVTIYDDDSDAILVSKTSASIAEGGAGDSYTIELATTPTNPVTIIVAAGMVETSPTDSNMVPDPFDCQLTVNGGGSDTLVFTQKEVPQTVTIAAVDDSMVETDPHTFIISNIVSTNDAIYSGLSADNVSVDIADDDARSWSFGDDAALVVDNFSFETPALGDGGVQDFNEVNPVPGYEFWTAGELKIVDPTSGEWSAMYKTATEAPDGTQILYLDYSEDYPVYSGTENAEGVCEYLIEEGPVSYTYEVSVGVPEPNDADAYLTFYVSSNAPGTFGRINVPAADTFSLADGDLVAGEWVDIKVCGVVGAGSPYVGGVLSVGVAGHGVHVDNWRLTVGNHPCDGCYDDPTAEEGDLDDDCDVDLADFAIFAGNFLECGVWPDPGCITGW